MKVCLFLLLLLLPLDAFATQVRGRVDFALQGGMVPMNGALVDLCMLGGGCLRYVTGPDGMYYFNAAPGAHALLVNGRERARVQLPNQAYFDVAPVVGNAP